MQQLALAGFDPSSYRTPRHKRRPRSQKSRPIFATEDENIRVYLRRLAARGASSKGISAYQYGLRATASNASRLAGHPVTITETFRDASLLGRALIDDEGSVSGHRLSRWTLAQRRSAVRSFAQLMRPELRSLLGQEPIQIVERALQGVAERVGQGYRLSGGLPRQRGGVAPDPDQLTALAQAVGRVPGFEGLRNRAFFGVLATTGSRVNALRLLDGIDCLALPDGRVRLYLYEKGKHERREVELGAEVAVELRAYVDACNQWAAARGRSGRVRLGEAGAVWRNVTGRRWGYAGVLKTLRNGCRIAGIPPFSPHSLRRSFATEAASRMPRHVVALAGGWKGLERLDDHYIQPREVTIWEKLARLVDHGEVAEEPTYAPDPSAFPVR